MERMPPFGSWTVSTVIAWVFLLLMAGGLVWLVWVYLAHSWKQWRRDRRAKRIIDGYFEPYRPSPRSLAAWSGHTGPWWKFWSEDSGIIGGIIMGLIIGAPIVALILWGLR